MRHESRKRGGVKGRLTARPRWMWLLLLIAVGGGSSIIISRCVAHWERMTLQSEMAGRAEERVELLRSKMLCSFEVLYSLRTLISQNLGISPGEFRDFVEPALERKPSLLAFGWSPRVLDAQRGQFVAAMRAAGNPNFRFTELDASGHRIPAQRRPEYFPIVYIEPAARNRSAIGFELGSNTVRDEALRAACDTGRPVATAPVHLVQEQPNQLGFIVYLAVYRGPADSLADRRKNLAGYASAVYRLPDLLGSSFVDLATGLNATVRDQSAGGLTLYQGDLPIAPGPSGVATLDIAGRTWQLTLDPTPEFMSAHRQWEAWMILGGGWLATLLICIYLHAIWKRTEEVERRVVERTAQLSSEVQERRRAESAARLAETQYRGIFENSLEGMFQTSVDGHYLRANRALARMYGYDSPEELIDRLADIASQLYVDPARREQFAHEVQTFGRVSDFESQIRRRDGSIVWISENARAVPDESGAVLYYEGTVIDITARKTAEESLRRHHDELERCVRQRTNELAVTNQALQAEVIERRRAEDAAACANAAKTKFLADLSHEIRTPMNAILGYAQILQRDPSLRCGHREAMETIVASGNHLMGLIEDILDLSKIEAGKVELNCEPFDLAAMTRSLAAMFRQRCVNKGISLRCHEPMGKGRACWVDGDERRLRQVVINLLGNAVNFTDHGQIELNVEHEGDDRYRFSVADTGVGISPDAIGKIFEAFEQAPGGSMRGGTGLGLAIARRLIRLMEGELSVTSQPGGGSTFWFTLRLAAAGANAMPSDALTLGAGQMVRAMVVDDVPANGAVLSDLLRQMGCSVVAVPGGREALSLLEGERHGRFDVIFMDIMMPGMNGVETARRVIDRLGAGAVKLVATTGCAFNHERKKYLEAGFDDVLLKPMKIQRLARTLSRLLGVEFRAADPAEVDEVAVIATGIGPLLARRLRLAAGLHQVTDLKACLREIEATVPGAVTFARQLRRHLHEYDMDSICRLLDRETAGVGGEC